MSHAKDVLSKYLFEAFPADAFSAFGLHGIHLTRALPTELVEVYHGTTDFVWESDDQTIVHIEFQARKEPTLYRFLVYDALLAQRYRRAIRTLVLNIGPVTQAPDHLDAGSIDYTVDNLYLNRIDGEAVLAVVTEHLATGHWTPEDRVRLAFAWHLRYDKHNRVSVLDRVLHLIQEIPDTQEQNLVTALLLGLSAPQLSAQQEQQLKEALKMTNVVREIEREAAEKATAEAMQEAMRQVAQKMLRLHMPLQQIADITNLSVAAIEALQRSMPQ
jgi:predicted transposase/invertase (TIGR01784 family)